MSENTNTTNSNENEDNVFSPIEAAADATIDVAPVKLHVLNSDGPTQDIALMQIGDKNMLIDSGISNCTDDHIAEIKKILKYNEIAENAPVPDEKKIHYIYITHYHWDHAGGLTAISNAIDMHGATIFLPENPPQEYYIVDDHLNNTYDVAKNCEMTVVIPGGTAGRYIKTTTNNVDSYTFEHLTDISNKTSFSIGRNHELTLDFKNCSTHDYYFYKDESGNERFRTETFTETIKASTNSFVPKKSLIKNGIKDTNGNYYDFKITIKGEAPYYASVTLDSNGNKKYPSITVPTNGSATIEYLGINADYNNTSLCCIMTYGKTRIGFFGDIGLNAQKNLANTIGHLDLMNVEHHGRNGGHYRPFYDSIAPKMCFTQDGNGNDGNDHILSTMSKTQEYLQENGIPNYPVSENGTTMTFNIYKSGISTTANAAKYAVNFKGATSIFSAVQDNVPGKDRNITLYNLLKNMEHGTFLSCAIRNNNIQLGQLFELLGIAEAEYAEFIAYKNGSIYNNSQLSIEKKLDSGYIVLIPHSKNPSCSPVSAYWSLNLAEDKNPSADINIVFKPIRDTEHFKFFKDLPKDSDFKEASGFKNGFLSCENLVITPSESCMVNYSILLKNQSPTTSKTITFNDGSSTKTFIIPSNGNVTVSNVVNLNVTKKDSAITEVDTISIAGNESNLQDLYVRISGYVTTQAKTVTKTLKSNDNALSFPSYGGYPLF